MCATSSVFQLSGSKIGWSSNTEPHPREAPLQPSGFREDGLTHLIHRGVTMQTMDPMTHYDEIMAMPSPAPPHWAEPCTHQECSLHQLSPYIGKLKSSIAQDLILRYSKPGELVADMFCGSGTVPLEAVRLGRRVFASDASIYAVTLTQGKLQAPMTSETALAELEDLLQCVDSLPMPDLRCVPRWVRAFFHPHTLKKLF